MVDDDITWLIRLRTRYRQDDEVRPMIDRALFLLTKLRGMQEKAARLLLEIRERAKADI